jgi:Protein of unknown function (DUF3617)
VTGYHRGGTFEIFNLTRKKFMAQFGTASGASSKCARVLGLAAALCCFQAAAQNTPPRLYEVNITIELPFLAALVAQAQAQKTLQEKEATAGKLAKDGIDADGIIRQHSLQCLTQNTLREAYKKSPQSLPKGLQDVSCASITFPPAGPTQNISFACTGTNFTNEGFFSLVDENSFVMKTVVTATAKNQSQRMAAHISAQFISNDCGDIKPTAIGF